MIGGEVREGREAVVSLQIAGPTNQLMVVECVIDTGFTDYLTVPASVVRALGLRYRESMVFELAGGELAALDLYECTVLWEGGRREVVAAVSEGGPLLGMAMLAGCCLQIDVVEGGAVSISQLA